MATEDDERRRARRQLAAILSCADDEAFSLMTWGINALQSGNPEGGALVFPSGFPPEAAVQRMTAKGSVYPWELETIVNELLATPKSMYQTVPCGRWETVPEIINFVRRVDDLDFAVRKDTVNIFRELFRISGRQFDWQRGYFNGPQFYRNIFIYGQGACAAYFLEKHGISINDLSVVGFGLAVFDLSSDLC